MRPTKVLSYVAVAAVLIIGSAVSSESRAAPIPVPNSSFEEIYKPGSTTITADLGTGWTTGVGPAVPMNAAQIADFSDGTQGTAVDVPGWIGAEGWENSYGLNTNPNRKGSIGRQASTPDGLYYYLANGGDWGNEPGGVIASDAPLGTVGSDRTYTLSMIANGAATPVLLDLLAGGALVTPTSSVDPTLSDTWQEFSRTYGPADLVGFLGQPLTIRLGVDGRPPDAPAAGTQSHFDQVSLSFEETPFGEPIPEPLTMTCLFAGMAALGGYVRRRRTPA